MGERTVDNFTGLISVRHYVIPPGLLEEGENLLAARIFAPAEPPGFSRFPSVGPSLTLAVLDQPATDVFRDLTRRGFTKTLVEGLPFRRIQYRIPKGFRTSSMRCVGPPRFLRLMRMSAGSRGMFLTLLASELPGGTCLAEMRRAWRRPPSGSA